ncbi:rhamnogalacturonyl hydrolase YesR [Paenibacillus sp. BK720]|nr:rhamnogalacturonyl hydrolase YesR [Paenibacillus sp. BK720]
MGSGERCSIIRKPAEVSATAGIAAAMVTQNNPLHAKYAQKALNGVLANIAAAAGY